MTTITGHDALLIALEAAVPLHIIELQDRTPEQRVAIAQRSADEVACHGDTLQFGGGKRGDVAAVFNHLARGLAAGAFAPGGITFAGHHWCTDHAVCLDADAGTATPPPIPAPAKPRRPIVDVELPA